MWTRFAPCCRSSIGLFLRAKQQKQCHQTYTAISFRLASTSTSKANAIMIEEGATADADEDDFDAADFEHLGQSKQLKRMREGSSKDAMVVQRPTSFKKKLGFPHALLQHMNAFPHALLLCRVGHFYESYFDQAIVVSNLLKIKLTVKKMEGKEYPMCGVPIAQLDKHLETLVREHNQFVAICEEIREYNRGVLKSLKRKVTRVVTPGTLVDEAFLEKRRHNYILAVDIPQIDSDQVELAWMDTSTGEFFTQSSNLARRAFQEDVARITPTEIVVPQYLSRPENQAHPILTALRELDDPPIISHPHSTQQGSTSAGVSGSMAKFSAVPLLSLYISETLLSHRPDLSHPLRVDANNSMRVDRISLRALEIKQNNDGGTSGTLLSVMDKTVTAAGSRLLSDRIRSPSMSLPEINARLSVVSWMKEHRLVRDELVEHLKLLDDETRLLQKLSIGQPTAEDLLTMSRAIKVQGQIKALLERANEKADAEASATGKHDADIEVLKLLAKDMSNFDALAESIEQSVDVKAVRAQKTRDAAAEAEADPVEESEAADTLEETGIDIWNIPDDVFRRSSKDKKVPKAAKAVPLDAAETNVPLDKNGQSPIDWGKFGDSVLTQSSSKELLNLHKRIDRVELAAKRSYSHLSKELYISSADHLKFKVMPRYGPVVCLKWLKSYPKRMHDALEALVARGALNLVKKGSLYRYYTMREWTKHNSEMQILFVQLREMEDVAIRIICDDILSHWYKLRTNARVTAELDVACGLARAAEEGEYVRPELSEDSVIHIEGGRHAVAEHELRRDGRIFVPNDTHLDNRSLLHIVTGPNMGGKSTVLRQVGLICILAQAGSFVPARKAHIGMVDQLFARIRYSDNIARGRSSFQVEMDDAAFLLENATNKSLVLLDEFGRGTTAEYAACIAESTIYALAKEVKARSLFATHLHAIHDIIREDPELAGLESIKFFCTRLSESDANNPEESFRYLYELVPGINRDAEAFTVAKMARYPKHLLKRARAIYEKRIKQ